MSLWWEAKNTSKAADPSLNRYIIAFRRWLGVDGSVLIAKNGQLSVWLQDKHVKSTPSRWLPPSLDNRHAVSYNDDKKDGQFLVLCLLMYVRTVHVFLPSRQSNKWTTVPALQLTFLISTTILLIIMLSGASSVLLRSLAIIVNVCTFCLFVGFVVVVEIFRSACRNSLITISNGSINFTKTNIKIYIYFFILSVWQ